MSEQIVESDWTMQMEDGGEVFPFVEDENCMITGAGHQDRDAFAAAVNRYDAYCNPGEELDQWSAVDIGHAWVTPDPDGERLHPCAPADEGAIAVTTLWGQR